MTLYRSSCQSHCTFEVYMMLSSSNFSPPCEIPGHKSFGSLLNSTASASALETYAQQVIDGEGERWVPKECFCCDRCPWQQPLGWVMKGLHGGWTSVEFKQLSSLCTAASRGALMLQCHGGQDEDTRMIQKEELCMRERVRESNVALSVAGCYWKCNCFR